MSIAAYPAGLSELTNQPEWLDNAVSAFRNSGKVRPDRSELISPPPDLLPQILFATLRSLHARQAEKLATISWKHPHSGAELRLLEDNSLRDAYGGAIGRIAHSHNWNIETVLQKLRGAVGAAANLPSAWTLDEVKVGLLLRCSDASHIDHRRAPTFLYALAKPTQTSDLHWNFQNKLNKPVSRGDTLYYASGNDFEAKDYNAWWLCYDIINMIDGELRSSNAALQDSDRPQLAMKRVFGAGNPSKLSESVRPVGWQPVQARIAASDPARLAFTLGGKNLYGDNPLAPIRELMQNAADAIRARRKYGNSQTFRGKIVCLIQEEKFEGLNECWLHIKDDGIGMSETVLTGPLLDFGTSFWSSALVREEFPGLEASDMEPIGKFGIGFFSVFLLGKEVKVTSRRFDQSQADSRTLIFSGLNTRPLLKKTSQADFSPDHSTVVSVKVSRPEAMVAKYARDLNFNRREAQDETKQAFCDAIKSLVSALDIDVSFSDATTGIEFFHSSDWTKVNSDIFLNEMLSSYEADERAYLVKLHASHMQPMVDQSGRVYGRAAVRLLDTPIRGSGSTYPAFCISVGGFLYSGLHPVAGILGVMSGDTSLAARTSARSTVPASITRQWASQQALLIEKQSLDFVQLLSSCLVIQQLGGDSSKLPYCMIGGKLLSIEEFKTAVKKVDEIKILLENRRADDWIFKSVSSINPSFIFHEVANDIVILGHNERDRLLPRSVIAKIGASLPIILDAADLDLLCATVEFKVLMDHLRSFWGTDINASLKEIEVFSKRLTGRTNTYLTIVLSSLEIV